MQSSSPLHALRGRFGRQIEYESHVRLDAAGRQFADPPQLLDVEPAGVPLINDVRQQKAIRDNRFAACQRGADQFLDHLRPRGHIQKSLRRAADRHAVPLQEQPAHGLAERRAPRIAAGRHGLPALGQPRAEQVHLRGFAAAVDAVEGVEQAWSQGLGASL